MAAAACSSPPPRSTVPLGEVVETDSRLSPGDTFEVNVYGEADLSGKYRVADDGSINFPLIGNIAVAGKASSQIAGEIREALQTKGILRAPNVSVFLLEQTSKRVSVMGAVARPGSYPLTPGLSVVQAVGVAGGLTTLARGDDAVLTRHVGGKLQRFRLAVESITEGRAADVQLRAGDIIFVPERVF